MATLECTNDQMRLIQDALELYSRIGILQIDHIMYHPSIAQMVENQFRPKKDKLEVGDKTNRGTVIEIGKKYIITESTWSDWRDRHTKEQIEKIEKENPNGWYKEKRKWTDINNIKLSINYNQYHSHVDKIKEVCSELKNLISGNPHIQSKNASYSIGRKDEGSQNEEAYNMIQVIRHEFWKENPNRSLITVDSSVIKFGNTPLIKVNLDKK